MTHATTHGPRLPARMRLMPHAEMRLLHDAVRASARRHGVSATVADAISYDALAAAGVFVQPPAPQPGRCTALYLPYAAAYAGTGLLGMWQQCDDAPGHRGDAHDNGEIAWRDGDMGTVPATIEGEA